MSPCDCAQAQLLHQKKRWPRSEQSTTALVTISAIPDSESGPQLRTKTSTVTGIASASTTIEAWVD